MRKASVTGPHFAQLFAAAEVGQAKTLSEEQISVNGDVKDGEPVSEDSEVLVASRDYVEEKFPKARPINNRGPKGARWVSPPSVLAFKRLTNLYKERLLEKVEAFSLVPDCWR
uniref:Uncharacterized protein n=1 Tax=Cannabis sativa TaxID=3483 RepID=A0A803PBV0_CANSA